MKRRLISCCLALCMALTLIPAPVYAVIAEDLGVQEILLPIRPASDAEEETSNLFQQDEETFYVYEGVENFNLTGYLKLMDPADPDKLLGESAGLYYTSGIVQLVDEDGNVAAASSSETVYDEDHWEDDENGNSQNIFDYYYVSHPYFNSNNGQDLTALEPGEYRAQFVCGVNNEDIYPLGATVEVVPQDSLFLCGSEVRLYTGADYASAYFYFYGVENEDELSKFSCNLLTEDGSVVGSSSGRFRNVSANNHNGYPAIGMEAEIVLKDGVTLDDDTIYTLQLLYTGTEKPLYSGVEISQYSPYSPRAEITDVIILDPQESRIAVTLESFAADQIYLLEVTSPSYGSGSDFLAGQYRGEISRDGVVEIALGKNGIALPMSSFGERLEIRLYDVADMDQISSYNFDNPYANPNYNHGSGGSEELYCSAQPYTIAAGVTEQRFEVQIIGIEPTGRDTFALLDGEGNVLSSGTVEVTEQHERYFLGEVMLRFPKGIEEGRYTVRFNDTVFEDESIRVTTGFRTTPSLYQVDEGEDYMSPADNSFYTLFGKFPVSIGTVNGGSTATIAFYEAEIVEEEYDEGWYYLDVPAGSTPVLSSGTLTGKSGEYHNYTYFEYNFTYEELNNKLNAESYYVLRITSGGQSNDFALGRYDGTPCVLDFSELVSSNYNDAFHIPGSTFAGDTTVPLEFSFYSDRATVFRNLTEEALEEGVKKLSFCHQETENAVAVTGYKDLVLSEYGSGMELTLTLNGPLSMGSYRILYSGRELDRYLYAQEIPDEEEEVYPPDLNYRAYVSDGFVRGSWLPEDGVYTAKLYKGYDCLTETAVTLTLETEDVYDQYLHFPESAAFDQLAPGTYELRVYLNGALLDAVPLIAEAPTRPTVQLITDLNNYTSRLITTSPYYCLAVLDGGEYTMLRAAESKEALAAATYETLRGSFSREYCFSSGGGEKTVYVQLAGGSGETLTESDVLTFRAWYRTDSTPLSVYVHESMSGIYSGSKVSFSMGADMRYAQAWMEGETANGETVTIPLAYAGFDDLPPLSSEVSAVLQSSHPYKRSSRETWHYTVEDAEELLVSFSSDTQFESGYDYLYIYAGDFSADELYPTLDGEVSYDPTEDSSILVGKYTDTELAGKTITVPSGSFTLLLTSDGGVEYYGFAVTSVVDPNAEPEEEEPEDTSNYKHIFTSPNYHVDDYLPNTGVRLSDLSTFRFYLADENGRVLSETVERSLVFRAPDEILLPWYDNYEFFVSSDSFDVYGYTSPNCSVTVSYNDYSNGYRHITLDTVSDDKGYFSIPVTGLTDNYYYYLDISDGDNETDDVTVQLQVDRSAPIIDSAAFAFGDTGTATLNWTVYDDGSGLEHCVLLCLLPNGTVSTIDSYIYPSDSNSQTVSASRDDGKIFIIRAYDEAGNMSEVELSTADTVPPEAPADIEISARTTTSVSVSWEEGTDDNEVTGYDIYLNGTRVAKDYAGTSYLFSDLTNGSSYQIAVKTRDKAGNTSLSEAALSASPVALSAELDMDDRYVVDLYTDKRIPVAYFVTDDDANFKPVIAEAEFRFRRANSNTDWTTVALNTDGTGIWDISGSDEGLLPLGSYELILSVTDEEGVTVESKPFTAILGPDVEAPVSTGGIDCLSYSTSTITFGWDAFTDNVAVDHYLIFRNGEKIGETKDLVYTDRGLAVSTEYRYTVKAVDGRGNISEGLPIDLCTLTLKFSYTLSFAESYVMEDQPDGKIYAEASVEAVGSYTPDVTVDLEYRRVGTEEWLRDPLTGSKEFPALFVGDWIIGTAAEDGGYTYIETGAYEVRFAVTDPTDEAHPVTAYSEIQTVELKGETEIPVVTDVSPWGGTHNGTVDLWANATDNVAVTSIAFYLGETLIGEVTGESGTVHWDSTAVDDGEYTVTVKAYDKRGNVGSYDFFLTVDNTPPAVPSEVIATPTSRYIHLMWCGTDYEYDADFHHFVVYRAEEGSDSFVAVRESLTTIGYFDDSKTAKDGVTYRYYVTAVDALGNESEPSKIVTATFIPDEESPVIADMRPRENATLRYQTQLEVAASDNYALSTAIFSYRKIGGKVWTEIGTVSTDKQTMSTVFSYNWTLPENIEGGQYVIRALVYDRSYEEITGESGYTPNAPAELIRQVTILPYHAPAKPAVTAEAAYKKATISWTYDGDVDSLHQFEVYQGVDGVRKFVTSTKADTKGSCEVAIPKEGTQTFAVVARDKYGFTAETTVTVTSLPGEDVPPVAVITPAALNAAAGKPFHFSAINSTDNDAIASYAWNFGDGSTASGETVTHTYTAPGTYSVTLTVTDESGNVGSVTSTLTAHDISTPGADYALAEIKLVNSFEETLPPVEGAELSFRFEDEHGVLTYEASGITDGNGLVNLVVPAKSGIVTVTAEGFLATSRTVEVQPDENGVFSTTIGITPMNASVVDGSLKVEEMTYDEIVQAGISITAPENNHVWKFSAELQFVAGPALPFDLDTLPITGYYDDKGNFLGGSGWGWSSIGCGGYGGGGGMGFGFNVGVFPISEHFVLVIYGEAHWLKEMYNVELLVINNDYLNPIEQCEATLTLPDGLALAAMNYGSQNETIWIGDVAPKSSSDPEANMAKATWYVRGDEEGEYNLTATVTGKNPEPFVKEFTTDSPVKVYAGSALHLTIRAEDIAYKEEEYHVQFELKNVSHKSLYNLSFGITGAEQFRVMTMGENETMTQLTEEDFGKNMTYQVKELKSGESITIDFYTTIWFTSLLEFADLGPFDVGYYLRNVLVTTLEGSTTTIPHSVELLKSSHGTFTEWLMEQADGKIQDVIIDVVDKYVFNEIPFASQIKKIYEFTHTADHGEAASRCEISLDNGSFKQSDNIIRPLSLNASPNGAIGSADAITVYTDSKDYTISADGKTMTINDGARVYVEGAENGEATMTVKTWVTMTDGSKRENVYTFAYDVGNGIAGNADDLILQAPITGLTDGKTAVPYAGGLKKITFPYLLTDGKGGYLNSAENAQWSIEGADTTGLSIENGVLTIESSAKGGDYSVKLTVGEKSATQTFSLTREASVAQSVRIARSGIVLESDTLGADAGSYVYTILAVDQYGTEFEAEGSWTLSGSISGVSLTGSTLRVEDGAAGSVTLTAESNGKTASIEIAVIPAESIVVENISNTATTASAVITNESGTTAALQGMIVAYDEFGRMVGFGSASDTLEGGESLQLTLTVRGDATIAEVRVFVVNATTQPLKKAGSN